MNDLNYHRKCLGLLRAEKRRLKVVEAERRRREEQAAREWRPGYQDRKNLRNKLAAQALAEGRWGDAAAIAKDQAYEDYLMGNRSRADYEKGCENIDKNSNYLATMNYRWEHKKALEEGDPEAFAREVYKGTDPGVGVRRAYIADQANDYEAGYDVWINNDFIGSLEGKTDDHWSLGISVSILFFSIDINSREGVQLKFGPGPRVGASVYAEYDPNPYNKNGHIVGMSGYAAGGGGIYVETQSGDLRCRVGVGFDWSAPEVDFNPNQRIPR